MTLLIRLILVLCTISISATALDKIDGIAAVVDDEIILVSELNAYSLMRLNSLGLKTEDIDQQQYYKKFLDELIDGKILLVHGKKDSMITISDDEVDQATNNHISMLLRQNNLTLDSLEVELQRQQGISLAKFKADARKVIREQLLKQKVQQSYLFSNKVTKKDVEAFYNQYIDSLPKMGESVLLSKLSLKVSPSESIRQKAYEKIISIKQRIDNGEDFAECAKKFSDGPEAVDGGDLGFISKGTLSELLFEEKAFNLSPGQVSDPFETRLGFHIVSVLEKRDNTVHLRQIFIKVEPPEEEINRITQKLDSLRNSCKNRSDFTEAVKKYSQDAVSKSNAGLLRWTSLIELPSEIRAAIDSLSVGEISSPVKHDAFLSLFRVDDRVKERTLTLSDDYQLLEKKAKDIMAQKKLVDLVTEWKKRIYIDVRL